MSLHMIKIKCYAYLPFVVLVQGKGAYRLTPE